MKRFAAMLVAGLSAAPCPPAFARGLDGAAIVRGAGRVKPERARQWRDLSTADLLTAGVSVQAAVDQPLEMNLPDGVSVTLEPSALVTWMPASKLPTETNKWARGYCIILQDGELEVRMPPGPKGKHAFLVSTKAGTLTDWRGQLHVRVRGDSTAAAIYQGALVVGSNGEGFPVYDGAGILMRRGINPDKTRGIPSPPEWQPGSGGFLLQSSEAAGPIDLAWVPVSGAASYRVEIATDRTMVRVVDRVTTADRHYRSVQSAASAGYWVHVRAVGSEGIVGPWSAPRRVRVLRYVLPKGGSVARDGALVLPPGKSLRFPSTEGLQVAFENLADVPGVPGWTPPPIKIPLYWSPLPESVSLPDYAPRRILHLRDPATGAQARLLLVRRELRADVQLSPLDARWPLDPIDARITLRDPSGRVDVLTEPAGVQALLDLSPIPVAWQRNGSVWTGRIAPRLIESPTVVRVVVTDGSGQEIGRGFVELVPSGAQASR